MNKNSSITPQSPRQGLMTGWISQRVQVCITHLVVIREGDDGGAHPQDHGRVDLAVGVGGAVGRVLVLHQVVRGHGQHDGLLLQRVNVLHHAAGHQVLPAARTDRQQVSHPTTSLLDTSWTQGPDQVLPAEQTTGKGRPSENFPARYTAGPKVLPAEHSNNRSVIRQCPC